VVDTVTGDASTVVKADPANPMAAPPAFHGWAPDGRSLVLGLTRGGKSVLVLAPVRGGEERLVAFDQSRLGFPASGTPRTDASGLTLRWSPDGRRVAIVRASERVAYFMIENPLVAAIPLTTSR
jgi:Tol biopolymer transport system component